MHLDLKIPLFEGYDFNELIVFIHNSSVRPPSFLNKGFRVTTGSIYTYQIDRVLNEMLEEPYSSCLKNINEFKLNKTIINFMKKANTSYSQIDCIIYFRNLKNSEKSGCNCIKL